MRTFMIIWFGQLVSLLGTGMTRFALLIWAYEQTGSATTLALLGFFSFILHVVFSPIAGVLVDRWDRRRVMMVTDLGAGLMTAALLVLYSMDGLQIWHLYLAEALTGAFEAFQIPAYAAATTTLVPKSQYARVNGLRTLALSTSQVIAPFLGGLVLRTAGLQGVMVFDLLTFGVAISTLMLTRIPRPESSTAAARGSFWHEMTYGFLYIWQRPGLRGLLAIFTGVNLLAALTYYGVMPAMILARSGGDELALATVQGALGAAGVVGAILISALGLPRRRIHAALGMTSISFLFGDFLFAVGRTLPAWTFAALVSAFFVPFIISGNRAIWQVKVAPDVQGRVFAVQNMLNMATAALGYLIAGPLADQIFEPAMQPGGAWVGVFGNLVGTGPGAGMALMFVVTSLCGMTICVLGYLFPSIRRVEAELPDHDAVVAAELIS